MIFFLMLLKGIVTKQSFLTARCMRKHNLEEAKYFNNSDFKTNIIGLKKECSGTQVILKGVIMFIFLFFFLYCYHFQGISNSYYVAHLYTELTFLNSLNYITIKDGKILILPLMTDFILKTKMSTYIVRLKYSKKIFFASIKIK